MEVCHVTFRSRTFIKMLNLVSVGINPFAVVVVMVVVMRIEYNI